VAIQKDGQNWTTIIVAGLPVKDGALGVTPSQRFICAMPSRVGTPPKKTVLAA
jgi:hypothetical protein